MEIDGVKHKRRRRKSDFLAHCAPLHHDQQCELKSRQRRRSSNCCYCCCRFQLKRNPSKSANQVEMISSRSKQTPSSMLLFTLVSVCLLISTTATATYHQLHQQADFAANSSKPALSGLTSNHQAHYTASFSTPNQAINITHVTYDPLYDTIYLGATNVIYQLNGSDLSEQFEQTTGPVFDNPSCGITECRGYEENMKPTQNVNKILVVDYLHKKLLSCGSTKQGACRRYQLNNIAQKEDLISMAVAANDDNSSTYAFIAPAPYNAASSTPINGVGKQQQQVLYVAATYTKVGQSRDGLVPAIGTRMLDEGPSLLKLYENSFLDVASIQINSHLRDYFLVNYLYGFASSNYIYFVTVQKKATSRDYEELGYHTRLARICITDSSYNSYTEVDLKCIPNNRKKARSSSSNLKQPNEYPLLQDAILVDAGSQLLQSLGQNDQSSPQSSDSVFSGQSSGSPDDNKVLLGVFSSARDHTQYAGEHSALCAFSLAQIEDKFNDNIHNCYTGKMQSRNMEYIAGNVEECPKSGQGGNVVNFCHETLKINGTLPIVSEASIHYFNTTLTAITATSHVNTNLKNIYADQLAALSFNSTSKSASSQSATTTTTSNPSTASFLPQNAANLQQQQEQQHTVVFLGTSDGHLKKLLLNNASNAIEFEDLHLDSNPILSDIHVHSSGQQLIAATPYKVMRIPIHNCAQHTTCKECSRAKNPHCGWCSLKSSCTSRRECLLSSSAEQQQQPQQQQPARVAEPQPAAKQSKWISIEAAGRCMDLQAIVPEKVATTSTGKLDLYIERLPRLSKEHNYKCIFDWKEQTAATQTAFGLSCPLPKVMHRPKIQAGKDHAVVDLAVRSSETNVDSLNGKITFFDCQLHTTCKDCLSTNWGCNWCLNENICLFNTSKCEKTGAQQEALNGRQENSLVQLVVGGTRGSSAAPSVQRANNGPFASSVVETTTRERAGNTLASVNQCPMLDLGSSRRQPPAELLVPDGAQRELSLKVKNMPQHKGNVQCVVELENDKVAVRARIEHDRVICDNTTFSYAAEVGSMSGQLALIYSDNNILIDKTNISVYKCHLLAGSSHLSGRADCDLCRRVDARFNCAWCSGACQVRQRCLGTEEPCAFAAQLPRFEFGNQQNPFDALPAPSTKISTEGSNVDKMTPNGLDVLTIDQNMLTTMPSGEGRALNDVNQRIHDLMRPGPLYSNEQPPYGPYVQVPGPANSDSEWTLQRLSQFVTSTLLGLVYVALAAVGLAFVYSSAALGYGHLKARCGRRAEYRRLESQVGALEKSLRHECRIASMALEGDLNELVRHVDLTGIPLLNVKHYIMKVFFPGINNHPLLAGVQRTAHTASVPLANVEAQNYLVGQQNAGSIPRPLSNKVDGSAQGGADFPLECFERLVFTKPFLLAFVNTLERQPSFTIRDKVNVGSLIMIVLMERLDYATDILRTLLFQLVGRSVNNQQLDSDAELDFKSETSNARRLTRRASNLLGGLPIGKAARASALGKVVGGSASSLMQSTQVAAQMLLARVGAHKTSPLQPHSQYLQQHDAPSYLAGAPHQNSQTLFVNSSLQAPMMAPANHCTLSTTAFSSANNNGQQQRRLSSTLAQPSARRNARFNGQVWAEPRSTCSRASSLSRSRTRRRRGRSGNYSTPTSEAHLMLRRTDSIVEKMLTNWLALNMYDHFQGQLGQSLYMMFEALHYQLERGPIDALSGDAYYSLNEHKLLREPMFKFEVVNLYVIVDTDILQPNRSNNNNSNNNNNLLLDSSINGGQSFYDESPLLRSQSATTNANAASYATANTITLALHALDCDTISQVKSKILNALYRNSPYSTRLSPDDVELSLRQQQQQAHQHQTLDAGQLQFVTISLADEDFSSVTAYNGSKRLNTLRHYGVTDQAVMMLNQCRQPAALARVNEQQTNRSMLADMIDEHDNNPYSEIQYGPINRVPADQQRASQGSASVQQRDSDLTRGGARSWHLIRCDQQQQQQQQQKQQQQQQLLNQQHFLNGGPQLLNESASSSSNSPSIILLGNENVQPRLQQQQQQQYYHPSSSSTSSSGNVMDTNSTSANSSSMNVTSNLLMMKRSAQEQPIYCQIGSTSTRSQRGCNNSSYYCHVNNHFNNNNLVIDAQMNPLTLGASDARKIIHASSTDKEQESQIYLARMLLSKGTVQSYIDDFLKTILGAQKPTGLLPSMSSYQTNDERMAPSSTFNAVLCATQATRAGSNSGACPAAVKWLFDLLDEAALENGITDGDIIHSWKSNAFLLRFWVNLIKNPNYILDVEKTNTLDATLSVVAQTLMDSCSVKKEQKLTKDSTYNKLLFARNVPKYKGLVKKFYHDIASMRSVSDQEMIKQMASLSLKNSGRFNTNLALKELCVYAVNYGVELMSALNNDFTCQQMDLSQQLEQCFRSFTIFEAYR